MRIEDPNNFNLEEEKENCYTKIFFTNPAFQRRP